MSVPPAKSISFIDTKRIELDGDDFVPSGSCVTFSSPLKLCRQSDVYAIGMKEELMDRWHALSLLREVLG